MVQDAFLTKSLTSSGTSAQYPTGVIESGGSAVDEWDLGLLSGSEPLFLAINVTATTGTDETFTPTLVSDDNVGFSSGTVIWTCPVAITATGLYIYRLPAVRERYVRLSTGTIGGTSTPGFTLTAMITTTAPHGRLT
jgi:hypothetical protein